MQNIKRREYYSAIPAGYVIFRDENKILLLLRKNTGYHDGEYSLPAGHIEDGEYVAAGTIREAKEEAGADISPEDLTCVHIMYRRREVDRARTDFFFEAKKWNGEICNVEPHKCGGLDWYDISELPQNILPYIKSAIESYVAGEFYSEFDETDGNRIVS